MLWVPTKGVIKVQHNMGSIGAFPFGAVPVTGASSSTKGSYAALISGTTLFDAWRIDIIISSYSAPATDSRLAVDIAIGAAPEEVIIANLLAGGACIGVDIPAREYRFPLYIPAGSTLSCRGAGDRVSTGFRVGCRLVGGNGSPPYRVAGRCETYGIGTVPAGTTVVPGASGAEGAWTQIVSSTTRDHFAFVPSWQAGLDTTKSGLNFFVDMGLGSATEEAIVGGVDYIFSTHGNELETQLTVDAAFQDVPAGTRLAMRASCNGVLDAGNYNGVIHALS